jgi:hypothetical protein
LLDLPLPFDKDYWVEVVVSGETLSPRQRLTAAPYALALPGLVSVGGNIGIGTTSPAQALDVNGSIAIAGVTRITNTGAGTLAVLSLGTPLGAASGGTGQNSYAIGDVLYASGAAVLSKLSGVATGNALISGGIEAAPSWGKIGLTTHVSGTLPVGSGGTGATSLTGYVKGSGGSAFTASATIPNTDITGLGTMSTQNANSVAITGGSITGGSISGLTSLGVSGTASATSFSGAGTGLTGTATNLIAGAISNQGALATLGAVSGGTGGTITDNSITYADLATGDFSSKITSGTYNIAISGNAATATNANTAVYATSAGNANACTYDSNCDMPGTGIWNSAGNVGIGTTSFTNGRLQIQQASDAENKGLAIVNSGGARWISLWVDANNKARIDSGYGGQYDLILNSGGGNVGIGTTSPGSKLSVSGGAAIGSGYTTATPSDGWLIVQNRFGIGVPSPTVPLEIQGSDGTTAMTIRRSTGTSVYDVFVGDTGGAMALRNGTGDAKVLLTASGSSYLMGGNVGIGTTNPTTKLYVSGANPGITIDESGSSNSNLIFSRGASQKWLLLSNYGSPTDNIAFYDTSIGQKVFQINPGGNVGIAKQLGLSTTVSGYGNVTISLFAAGLYGTSTCASACGSNTVCLAAFRNDTGAVITCADGSNIGGKVCLCANRGP